MTPGRLGLVATSVVTLLGVAAALVGTTYGVFDDDGRIAAGFLPVLVATIVAVCGALDVINRLRARQRSASAGAAVPAGGAAAALAPDTVVAAEAASHHTVDAGDDDIDIFGRTARQRTRMLWAVLGILTGSLLLVPLVGFMVAFAIVLVGCSFVVERRALLPTLLISGAALGGAYLLFGVFLRVPLPTGIFGI